MGYAYLAITGKIVDRVSTKELLQAKKMIKIYEIASATIYKWNNLYKKDDDTGASKADLLEMQAKIAKLESENDILKKP